MELFTINRYTGEFPEVIQNRESEILKDLLKKVEKRKRKFKELEKNEADKIVELEHDESEKEADSNVSKKNKIDTNVENVENISTPPVDVDNNFQILGDDVFKKKQKIEMVLPPWLAHPVIISNNISKDGVESTDQISNISYISPEIIKNLKSIGIEKLFPVQQEVIPWLLNVHSKPSPFRPRDICVSAPTGSGKTLAFAVPIVQLLSDRVERKIRALIVLPVNELALQVFKVFKRVAEQTSLSICLLSKSFPFVNEQQELIECYKGKYYAKVDIVVTTPGRLVEHLHATKGFCLKNLKFLVIDEADRIMEQIHHNWLYHLDEHVKQTSDLFLSGRSAPLCLYELEQSLSKQPHKLLFSATLSQDPEKLQNLRLFQPKLFTSVLTTVDELTNKILADKISNGKQISNTEIRGEFIGKYTTPAELIEQYCLTENRLKPLTLYSLISKHNWNKFLCFTNSADSAHRLAFVLKYMFKQNKTIFELSSTLNQKKRTQVLDLFSRGKINGLVCSDALARGIDIPEVDIVISYDSPRHIKTYIHRIGRTARAGRPGTAITILAPNEIQKFNHTISEAGKVITEEIKVDSNIEEKFAKTYTLALTNLQNKLEHEKKMKIIHKNMIKGRAIQTNNNMIGQEISLMDQLQTQAEGTMLNKLKKITDKIETDAKVGRKFRKKIKTNLKKKEKSLIQSNV